MYLRLIAIGAIFIVIIILLVGNFSEIKIPFVVILCLFITVIAIADIKLKYIDVSYNVPAALTESAAFVAAPIILLSVPKLNEDIIIHFGITGTLIFSIFWMGL
jgi:hypothetical protein